MVKILSDFVVLMIVYFFIGFIVVYGMYFFLFVDVLSGVRVFEGIKFEGSGYIFVSFFFLVMFVVVILVIIFGGIVECVCFWL